MLWQKACAVITIICMTDLQRHLDVKADDGRHIFLVQVEEQYTSIIVSGPGDIVPAGQLVCCS